MIRSKIGLIIVLWVMVLGVAPAQSQGDLAVSLETTPVASQIGPDNTLVRTTLKVVDGSGQVVPNAYLKLHLDAPPGNPIISTDFPIVENTVLMEYEGTLPEGVLEFEYIYPIRGQYSFHVEAGRDATALPFKDTLHLKLSENRNELINLILFILFLLGLGLVAGLIIGNGARAQRLAAAGVVIFLWVGAGFMSSSAPAAQAHGGGDGAEVEPFTESASEGNLTLTYAMNPGAGRVGTLNTLTFAATDASGAPAAGATFEVALWHIEDDKPVFTSRLYAPEGHTRLDFQFFDGAEHEVRVATSSPIGSVNLSRVVEVEGIDPPLPVKIKTTVYLVLVTLVGILIGLRIQVSRGKRQEFTPVRV